MLRSISKTEPPLDLVAGDARRALPPRAVVSGVQTAGCATDVWARPVRNWIRPNYQLVLSLALTLTDQWVPSN